MQLNSAKQRVLSFVSHDVEQDSEFFQPLKTADFMDDGIVWGKGTNGSSGGKPKPQSKTVTSSGGGGNRNRSSGGGGGGGAKIDIYLLKTKNATKVLAAVKMCRACLLETQKKVEQVLQENKEINQMVTGFLYSILVWVRIWFKVMVDDMCDVHVSFDLPSLLSL